MPVTNYALALAEKRPAIVQDAIQRIQEGAPLRDIAKSHGIHYKTLQGWLLALGDEYASIRQTYIDQQLIAASDELSAIGEAIDTADATDIPRMRVKLDWAKSEWARAAWLAERRDRARYGAQASSTDHGPVSVSITIGSVTPQGVTIEGGVVKGERE